MEVIIKCSDDCRGSKNIYGEPTEELIRCKDCKYYDFSDERAFGMPTKRCKCTGFEDMDYDDFC